MTTTIDSLIDSHVRYTVTGNSYTIRAATKTEVDAHYEASRPAAAQTPVRDLSVTAITALSDVAFGDWDAFGVKATNVAVLGTLGFAAGTVPDGFAVPFYFYDEFMKANELDAMVTTMLAENDFQESFDTQEKELKKLRNAIKDATTPAWIITALEEMHAEFPDETSLRYRSSTNNEDLPGFSGAGLYDSKTQDPDETVEDGIDKSIKGVWASLWNFRAFVERDFNRIDHNATAMGVLVHPNYSDELANGVAVSHDPFSNRAGAYYVNTQIGEDLVTNPEARSVPEELLLLSDGGYDVIVYSNQVASGQPLMSDAQLAQLRGHLATIHSSFKALYAPAVGERFAMEIEFKITSDDVLAIKQARPWVFRPINEAPTFPDTESAVRSIPELTRKNTDIGAPVAATDAEGDTMTYTLSGADAEWFRVDSSSGQLLTEKPLDFETQDRHEVDITVGDPFNAATTTIMVTINVTDVDEPADITFTEGSNVTANDNALTVNENYAGSLATFSASDPEMKPGLTYQWSVVGTDGGDFAFTAEADTRSGELSFAANPDYERPADSVGNNVYDITVNARDSDNKTGRINVTVTVEDVDEPADISFVATGGVTVNDNALTVDENHDGTLATFRARDPENDQTLTYTWSTDPPDHFVIRGGVLSFKNIPDYELPAGGTTSYDIAVSALDSGGMTGSIAVTVTVTNVDEPPEITLASAAGGAVTVSGSAVSVDENHTSDLVGVTATDPETHPHRLHARAGGNPLHLVHAQQHRGRRGPQLHEPARSRGPGGVPPDADRLERQRVEHPRRDRHRPRRGRAGGHLVCGDRRRHRERQRAHRGREPRRHARYVQRARPGERPDPDVHVVNGPARPLRHPRRRPLLQEHPRLRAPGRRNNVLRHRGERPRQRRHDWQHRRHRHRHERGRAARDHACIRRGQRRHRGRERRIRGREPHRRSGQCHRDRPRDDPHRLHARAGGNPLHLVHAQQHTQGCSASRTRPTTRPGWCTT